MIAPTYYCVFFDIDKPKNHHYAMNLRIPRSKFINLIDDKIPNKTVELKDRAGMISTYRIIQSVDFQIYNTVDNNNFVVCTCKKI